MAVAVPTPDPAIATKETDSTAKSDRLTVRVHRKGFGYFPTQSKGYRCQRA